MELKQLFTGNERAVSPVIGVILMVAITVILAAVIGTFVLGLGDNVNEEPRAGVSFSQSSGDVTVTWTSEGNIDSGSNDLTVDWASSCSDTTTTLTSPGSTATSDCSSASGETITVTGSVGGQTGVIGQYEVE